MIAVKGHNIWCGLGFGSSEVYAAARRGESDLRLREAVFGVPQPFFSSLIDRRLIDERFAASGRDGSSLTAVEKAMILSAEDAIAMSGIDPSSPDTLFVISSTKGNVHLLEEDPTGLREDIKLHHSASVVARSFGNPNTPVCVTNACTSGVCAQIVAQRAIEGGKYSEAVVIGADLLCGFIVSGFQSLKALSPERCRPFDKDRIGLNLSDAVGTIVYSASGKGIGVGLERGSIRNDANHISAPSRTAVGQISAIRAILSQEDAADLAFVNAHGTATAYNDNMESIAIHECGLDNVPAVSYKSIFGHTLGAAGVIETVISCLALKEGVVFPTATYSENGVSFPVNVSNDFRKAQGKSFLKIMSGFGGINAAALYRMIEDE